MRTVISDTPACSGEENVLKRAAQLRDVQWTPVRPIPALYAEITEAGKEMLPVHLPAWRPGTGINYSAVRYKEKYIGTNVSLETYLSALSFPQSAMYNTTLHGKNKLASAFYGCVCSQYVSYCLGFPFQIDCQQFEYLDGMREIACEDLRELRLCDILNLNTRHTAIITGIDRYEDGSVATVTVSEATPPRVISGIYTPEVFKKHWFEDGFKVLRYDRVKDVPYTPTPFCPQSGDPDFEEPRFNPYLLPDYGDKANYLKGEPVVFTVFDGSASVVVYKGEAEAAVLPVENRQAEYLPESAGNYSAVALKEGTASEPCFFTVTDASVTLEKTVYAPGETVVPAFSNPAADRFLGYVVKTDGFAKVWGYPAPDTGVSCCAKALEPGEYLIISEYENAFGHYSSHPCFFTVR